MTSEKQIEANCRNAQKSTGPRTPEGKSRSCLNAVRDGFTCQITSLSDEDRFFLEEFKSRFVADLLLETVMELSLATAIAWDTWRLNHLRAIESNLFAICAAGEEVVALCKDIPTLASSIADSATFGNELPRIALMSIYEQRMNRSLHKNLATLRQLQAERKRNFERDREEEVILARASDINGLQYNAPATPSENGSVFANHEIFAAANRATSLEMAKMTLRTTPLKVQFAGAASGTLSNLVNWPGPEAA